MKEKGIDATVINPRNLSQLDTATLDSLRGYKTVITLEDGIPAIHVLGLRKEFVDRYNADELLRANSLTPPQIAARV